MPAFAAPTATRRAPAEAPEPEKPLRVLVVDDHEDSGEVIGKALSSMGLDVRVESDGLRALRVALDFIPQVVILDLVMPGVDGYHVAQLLRAQRPLAAARLLALTGWSVPDAPTKAWRAGFDGYMKKPLNLEDLKSFLARHFRRPGSAPEPAPPPAG